MKTCVSKRKEIDVKRLDSSLDGVFRRSSDAQEMRL